MGKRKVASIVVASILAPIGITLIILSVTSFGQSVGGGYGFDFVIPHIGLLVGGVMCLFALIPIELAINFKKIRKAQMRMYKGVYKRQVRAYKDVWKEGDGVDDSEEILRERFAQGEISKEEFLSAMDVLKSTGSTPAKNRPPKPAAGKRFCSYCGAELVVSGPCPNCGN